MKIFLVGFMGCGKSYIGKKLAQMLGFQFVDVDSVIENTEVLPESMGKVTIAKIFDLKGEPYFRQLESDRLRGLDKWNDIVIATGGGAACFHHNMQWMNEHGITVYLKTPPELLAARLKSEAAHRPILQDKTGEELLTFIEEKLAAREVFYKQAQIIVHQHSDGDEIIFDILQKILQLRIAN